MKVVFGSLVLLASFSTWAGSCDAVTGLFKTTTMECRSTRDRVSYRNQGHRDILITFDQVNKKLRIVQNYSGGMWMTYKVNYIVDGTEHAGRPLYEGEKYTATCEDNRIHIRAQMRARSNPNLIHDYTLTDDGKLTFKESFAGNSFEFVCEMVRD